MTYHCPSSLLFPTTLLGKIPRSDKSCARWKTMDSPSTSKIPVTSKSECKTSRAVKGKLCLVLHQRWRRVCPPDPGDVSCSSESSGPNKPCTISSSNRGTGACACDGMIALFSLSLLSHDLQLSNGAGIQQLHKRHRLCVARIPLGHHRHRSRQVQYRDFFRKLAPQSVPDVQESPTTDN